MYVGNSVSSIVSTIASLACNAIGAHIFSLFMTLPLYKQQISSSLSIMYLDADSIFGNLIVDDPIYKLVVANFTSSTILASSS